MEKIKLNLFILLIIC